MNNFAEKMLGAVADSAATSKERHQNIVNALPQLLERGASVIDPQCLEAWTETVNSLRNAKNFCDVNKNENRFNKLKQAAHLMAGIKKGVSLDRINDYLATVVGPDKIIDEIKRFSPSGHARLEKMLAERPVLPQSGRPIGGGTLQRAIERSKQNAISSGAR